MLKSFTIENYRAFARPQEIDVRPLTLFFGWNSGGKSALVRFLPLLAESIKLAGPPILLTGEVGRRSTWPDLVCKATERNALNFSLRWDDEAVSSAEWTITGDLEGRWQEVSRLKVTGAQPTVDISMPNDVRDGLLPQKLRLDRNSPVSGLSDQLISLASQVQWISGVRIPPFRVATFSGGVPAILQSDGGDVVDHLVAAQLKSVSDPMLEITRKFFFELGEHLVLDSPVSDVWRVMLRPIGAPKVQVNLCDTGEGYTQVLPVLVALARARCGGPKLLCLEQPELHLHTKAQAELAKILVETANDTSQPSLLVETHSEVLLMSVQLAIAEGRISSDKVRVYWIESQPDGTSDANPVDFDSQGRPNNSTLRSAFDEAIRLGQDLMMAQMARKQNGAVA